MFSQDHFLYLFSNRRKTAYTLHSTPDSHYNVYMYCGKQYQLQTLQNSCKNRPTSKSDSVWPELEKNCESCVKLLPGKCLLLFIRLMTKQPINTMTSVMQPKCKTSFSWSGCEADGCLSSQREDCLLYSWGPSFSKTRLYGKDSSCGDDSCLKKSAG